ncbi:MAG: hypothetical protein KC912_24645 [Proteobacteria bacterium]|nr:hypothetical protein [Pseudomonadota bacterium]
MSVRANGAGGPGPAATATVDIVNTPPSLTAAEFIPSTPAMGADLTCVPLGPTDADEDTLAFTYVWERAGTALSETSNTLPGSEIVTGEAITCFITPNDGEEDGNTVSVTGTATNSAPTSTGSSISPSSPVTTDHLVCTGSGGTDVDGDSVSFVDYEWRINGTLVAETSNTLASGDHVKGNTITCTALPFDGEANGAGVESSGVTVLNSSPAISQVLISPQGPTADDTIACTPTGSDADNDQLIWTYAWYNNDTVQSETSNFLSPGSAIYNQAVYCIATASDGSETASAQSSTLTLLNTPPVVTGVAISPTSADGQQELTCSYAGTSDSDGQGVNVTYTWTVDGNAAGTGATLAAGSGIRDQVAQCTATPNDGVGNGTPVSASLTFDNAPPSQPTVAINPTSANSEDPLTCSASPATDYDGETVNYTYRWTLASTEIGATDTLAAGLVFRGDSVVCTATPTDGTANGTAGTASLTIGNTAPTATGVGLSPSVATESTTLTCNATLDDVDGDTTSAIYRWTVGTTTISATGSTLTGTSFDKGEAVTCHVTPNDTFDNGTEVSSSPITIGNTAPVAPELVLSPSSTAVGAAPLVCGVATAATDIDPADNPLTHVFAWTLDGNAYTGAVSSTNYSGDTVAVSDVLEGTWVCTAYVTDGDGAQSSTATSNSAVVGAGGDVVPGFSGELGPSLAGGWMQCEGYYDVLGGDDIPDVWGDDCMGAAHNEVAIACGASTTAYRYMPITKNPFRDGLTGYPERDVISGIFDQSGGSHAPFANAVYGTGNNPNGGTSWWAGDNGFCLDGTNNVLTVNNTAAPCTYEAADCLGQAVTDRYLWVYVR